MKKIKKNLILKFYSKIINKKFILNKKSIEFPKLTYFKIINEEINFKDLLENEILISNKFISV
jgi:hypothetical protein